VRRITSCKENDDRRWRRLELTTHWMWLGEIPWRQTVQTSINE